MIPADGDCVNDASELKENFQDPSFLLQSWKQSVHERGRHSGQMGGAATGPPLDRVPEYEMLY